MRSQSRDRCDDVVRIRVAGASAGNEARAGHLGGDIGRVCRCGVLFPQGLAQTGLDPAGLVLVTPNDLSGALWAADETLKCRGVAAVVLQIEGNPHRFDMTATRRLMLRAQANGGFACMLR
ncbi:hypothetical protein [Breoghania sp.]|uniref:hypothetical protein n=1 Tax=Breoghania sp. TaxID=2065378 RepID=UPI002626C04B|nr:hypothetical protein [Breoghania sp.]MDJ0930787.1 hypothetical protein [Breoghania sp.]